MTNSSGSSSSGTGTRIVRWPFAATTIGILPRWWIIPAVTDPTLRLRWSSADFRFGCPVMSGPWRILAHATLRRRLPDPRTP